MWREVRSRLSVLVVWLGMGRNNGWGQELITMCLQNSELLTDHSAKILAKTVSVGMWWTSFMFLSLSIVGDHSDFGKNHTMIDLFSLRTRFWLIVYAVRQQVLRFASHYYIISCAHTVVYCNNQQFPFVSLARTHHLLWNTATTMG